jgi:hypothetical protein
MINERVEVRTKNIHGGLFGTVIGVEVDKWDKKIFTVRLDNGAKRLCREEELTIVNGIPTISPEREEPDDKLNEMESYWAACI